MISSRAFPNGQNGYFIGQMVIPLTRDHIDGLFRKVLRSLGVDPNRHPWKELRHTTASLMQRKGIPTLAIEDQLKHSNIRTIVDFYIGSDIDYQREQIENWLLKVGKEVSSSDGVEAYV